MFDGLAVLLAGLITWSTPGCAFRDEASLAAEGIEHQLAEELSYHAEDLQKAFELVKKNEDLSVWLQLQLKQNQLFATCGLSDSAVDDLARDKLQLRPVGKLAKSGDFFASTDSRWLVKAVSTGEQSKLAELGNVEIQRTEYLDCSGFNHSLLIPIPVAFTCTDGRPFLVMQNETDRLASLAVPEWQIRQSFDVKPLPNLSEQLASLIITLSTGWLGSLVPLSAWDGWEDVKNALQHDCHFLAHYNVVDFSLFVHVLHRASVAQASSSSSQSLSAKDGCITEPSGAAVVCFAILDYLVAFTAGRKLESSVKGDKFQAYGENMMHAFACIGALNGTGCEAYHDYGSILRAGDAEAKAAFLGSETFGQTYECQVEQPKLRYQNMRLMGGGSGFGSVLKEIQDEPVEMSFNTFEVQVYSHEVVQLLPAVMHGDGWSYNGIGYDANVSLWLQEAVSSNNGGHVIASGYEQLLEHELGRSETGFQLHEEELAACTQGIKLFATSSWRGQNKKHQGLGNVVWSPRSSSVFVVRGKNKLYSNSNVVTDMRKDHCFMLLRFFRCQASDRKRAMFDYKTSFGSIEVLQVLPSASSGADFEVFRRKVDSTSSEE